MSNDKLPTALHHYTLMWNERDENAIRGHVDRAVSEDCLWVDPQHYHVGRDALEANVRGFRSKFPNAELSLASNVDGHNGRYRYEWMIKIGEKVLIYSCFQD